MLWLWVVLYFVLGFIIDICVVVYDIKHDNFNPNDESDFAMILFVFALWPMFGFALLVIGFGKFVIFLSEILSEWIS